MDELYMVYDKEDGLICVANKEMAEKEYKNAVDSAQKYLNGMYLGEEDMGYQTIIAQVKRGYLLQMSEEINEWEESFVEPVKLNENQQIVLEWLKGLSLFPISAIHLLEAGKNVPENVKRAYEDFDKQEERQLLAAFAEWVTDEVAE